ncbi:MAG: transglutaminase-like cysteine peptidase [Tissierellia bacterium]|nr:transglutaminase-like cysteine peptidase [Tissierellia bacterium]
MTDKNLIKINDKWNELRYVSDYRQFLVKDYWQTPEEFFINGAGDCEDFAIAKFFDLLEMNYPPEP